MNDVSRDEAEFRVRAAFHGHYGHVPQVQLLLGERMGVRAWLGVALGGGVLWRVFVCLGGEMGWELLVGE
jgi:hypothetical protein